MFATDDALPNGSDHTQTDGPNQPGLKEDTEANKALVREYYETVHIGCARDKIDCYVWEAASATSRASSTAATTSRTTSPSSLGTGPSTRSGSSPAKATSCSSQRAAQRTASHAPTSTSTASWTAKSRNVGGSLWTNRPKTSEATSSASCDG
jgi:hypothetical protein